MSTFTVLMIATNRYVEFLPPLVQSIEQNLFTDANGQILVFTDQPKAVPAIQSDRIAISAETIPSLGWPDATLKRFEIFNKSWNSVTGDMVIYIDVDAVVVSQTHLADLQQQLEDARSEIFVVQHPGYFRRDWKTWIAARRHRGIWETRRQSTAYVPLANRRVYVAGGVWGGKREALGDMISQLRQKVDQDTANGIVAKSHDESHLNNWITRHHTLRLSPAWVFASGYANLDGIEPIIEVLHKPAEFFEAREQQNS